MSCGLAAFIYTTLPDEVQARALGEALVRERLAACVNILPGMRSIYEWKGELTHDEEVVLIAKTVRQRADDLSRRMAELHPYETPAILHLPVLGVNPPYLEWLQQQTLEKASEQQANNDGRSR